MDNISVIIRNRNEERYIGYAIQSVLDTFDKPEIIVVDNNSTDDSMNIVNTFDFEDIKTCLLYTSPSPRDKRQSRMPSSA